MEILCSSSWWMNYKGIRIQNIKRRMNKTVNYSMFLTVDDSIFIYLSKESSFVLTMSNGLRPKLRPELIRPLNQNRLFPSKNNLVLLVQSQSVVVREDKHRNYYTTSTASLAGSIQLESRYSRSKMLHLSTLMPQPYLVFSLHLTLLSWSRDVTGEQL